MLERRGRSRRRAGSTRGPGSGWPPASLGAAAAPASGSDGGQLEESTSVHGALLSRNPSLSNPSATACRARGLPYPARFRRVAARSDLRGRRRRWGTTASVGRHRTAGIQLRAQDASVGRPASMTAVIEAAWGAVGRRTGPGASRRCNAEDRPGGAHGHRRPDGRRSPARRRAQCDIRTGTVICWSS
jgi:hypothetical protein